MLQYLVRARAWLTVERLPGYAPELNPVEQIWGNIKGRELANLCPVDILALRCARASLASVDARRWPSVSCGTQDCRFDMFVTLFHETH